MAKVDEFMLTIDGVTHKYNINVGKEGVFRVKVEISLLEKLGMSRDDCESSDLNTLRSRFVSAQKDYNEACETIELMICINFRTKGSFNRRKDGGVLYGPSDSGRYGFDVSFGRGRRSGVLFDYECYWIEESTNREKPVMYRASYNAGFNTILEGDRERPKGVERYSKEGVMYGAPEGVSIPYTVEAMDNLEKITEGIRGMSEMLFDFITQDKSVVEGMLNGSGLMLGVNKGVEE